MKVGLRQGRRDEGETGERQSLHLRKEQAGEGEKTSK
jgi:hypothetical protein